VVEVAVVELVMVLDAEAVRVERVVAVGSTDEDVIEIVELMDVDEELEEVALLNNTSDLGGTY
jgi:hypothetical protein